MTSDRKVALVAGVFYLTVCQVDPAVLLISPVLSDSRYIVGASADA